MNLKISASLVCTFLALFAAFPAQAEEEKSPVFSADFVAEWQNEYRADSDDPAIDETNNSFFRAELAPHVRLSERFYIDGNLVLEPFEQVAEVNAGDDIWFDRDGVFAEELKLNFEDGPWHLWAGKIHPDFGRAWDWGRGIWSEDFAEDYEITEKIGGGASYTFGNEKDGTHTLSGVAFFADNTFLSNGVITARNHNSVSDGGASNTGEPNSFTVALNGENAGGVEGLTYTLGFRHLAEQDHGDATTDDENGVTVSAGYVTKVNENLSLDFMGEYAGIRDFNGAKDVDADYYYASAIATIDENWNVTVGYTHRDIDDPADDSSDHLLQLSGGYDFGNGFTADIGWRNSEEADADTNIIGGLVRYQHSF